MIWKRPDSRDFHLELPRVVRFDLQMDIVDEQAENLKGFFVGIS
jgi:hypothetical protein